MTLIYHIAEASDWAQAQRDGQYTMSTRGRTLAEEGFIHASTAAQVPLVAGAFYQHDPNPVSLACCHSDERSFQLTWKGGGASPLRAAKRPVHESARPPYPTLAA